MAEVETPEQFALRAEQEATDDELRLDERALIRMVRERDAAIREAERAGYERRIAELEAEREELYSARDLLRDRLQTVVDECIEVEPMLSADELITIVERALAEQSRRLTQLEREPVHVVAAAKAAGWGDSPRLLSEFVTWQGARIRELAAKLAAYSSTEPEKEEP